jgi:hypothetical protein
MAHRIQDARPEHAIASGLGERDRLHEGSPGLAHSRAPRDP